MGGLSRSRLRFVGNGTACFEGEVSLARNGGFASLRHRLDEAVTLSGRAVVLEACGDGRHYKFALRTEPAFDGISYQAGFASKAGVWECIRLPVAAFRPVFRGRPVTDAPSLQAASAHQLGLVIADRQAGAFRLALRLIAIE